MGFAVGDIARTPADFEQVAQLIQKFAPKATPAALGQPESLTFVVRDEEDRTKLHGLIHVERAWEVKHFLIDPEYKYQKVSGAILHRGMEMYMRVSGIEQYYMTVPREDGRVVEIYQKDGAEPIDLGALRFRKVL